MNTQHTPSADNLLHAFIDGELAADNEQQFYAILASDSEYRSKLRQLQAIRTQSLRYGTQTLPPAAMGEQLFAKLGLAPEQPRKRRAVIIPLLSSAWSPVASAAAAAFITAVIMLGLNQSPLSNPDLGLAANNPRPQPAIESSPAESRQEASALRRTERNAENPLVAEHQFGATAPLAGEDQHAEPASSLTTENATVPPAAELAANDIPAAAAELRSIPTGDDALPSTIASVDAASQHPLLPLDAADVMAVEKRSAINASSGFPGVRDGRVLYPAQDILSASDFLTIEVRGVTATSFPRATVPSNPAPWMENMAIALFYTDEQSDYGVEYGQEAFSQHYSGVENGKYVRYEQNLRSSLLIATLRHRLAPLQSFAGIEPYASVSAGSTFELWPLVKGGIGLMYMPDRRVRFHVGLEGSLLAYPYQQRWFTSKRAGITYGLSVLF